MGGKCCCCCFFFGGLGVLAWRAAADGLWFITFDSPSFSCYYSSSSPAQFVAAFRHEAKYCVCVGDYVSMYGRDAGMRGEGGGGFDVCLRLPRLA